MNLLNINSHSQLHGRKRTLQHELYDFGDMVFYALHTVNHVHPRTQYLDVQDALASEITYEGCSNSRHIDLPGIVRFIELIFTESCFMFIAQFLSVYRKWQSVRASLYRLHSTAPSLPLRRSGMQRSTDNSVM